MLSNQQSINWFCSINKKRVNSKMHDLWIDFYLNKRSSFNTIRMIFDNTNMHSLLHCIHFSSRNRCKIYKYQNKLKEKYIYSYSFPPKNSVCKSLFYSSLKRADTVKSVVTHECVILSDLIHIFIVQLQITLCINCFTLYTIA